MYGRTINSTKWDTKNKSIHKYQRRNWERVKIRLSTQDVPTPQQTTTTGCWEYGRKSDPSGGFHAILNSYDTFRRRLWIRRLTYKDDDGKR